MPFTGYDTVARMLAPRALRQGTQGSGFRLRDRLLYCFDGCHACNGKLIPELAALTQIGSKERQAGYLNVCNASTYSYTSSTQPCLIPPKSELCNSSYMVRPIFMYVHPVQCKTRTAPFIYSM
eukprot:6186117-Pleurochrysis_carterae.AAC.1